MQLLLHLPYNLAQLIFIALAQRTAGRLAEDIIAAAIRIQITIVVVIIFSRYWSKSIIRNAFRFIGCLTCFIWYFTFGIVESTALQGKHTWAANYWLIVGICSFKRFCHYLVTKAHLATIGTNFTESAAYSWILHIWAAFHCFTTISAGSTVKSSKTLLFHYFTRNLLEYLQKHIFFAFSMILPPTTHDHQEMHLFHRIGCKHNGIHGICWMTTNCTRSSNNFMNLHKSLPITSSLTYACAFVFDLTHMITDLALQ